MVRYSEEGGCNILLDQDERFGLDPDHNQIDCIFANYHGVGPEKQGRILAVPEVVPGLDGKVPVAEFSAVEGVLRVETIGECIQASQLRKVVVHEDLLTVVVVATKFDLSQLFFGDVNGYRHPPRQRFCCYWVGIYELTLNRFVDKAVLNVKLYPDLGMSKVHGLAFKADLFHFDPGGKSDRPPVHGLDILNVHVLANIPLEVTVVGRVPVVEVQGEQPILSMLPYIVILQSIALKLPDPRKDLVDIKVAGEQELKTALGIVDIRGVLDKVNGLRLLPA